MPTLDEMLDVAAFLFRWALATLAVISLVVIAYALLAR